MAERRMSLQDAPKLTDLDELEDWIREISIWQTVTDLPVAKQGAAIYLSLEGKAHQYCKTIDVEELKGNDGVKNLIKKN